MKSILDRRFRYTPASHTDIRRTFARIRREQQRAEAETQHELASVKSIGPYITKAKK